jgi:hypothetical protein
MYSEMDAPRHYSTPPPAGVQGNVDRPFFSRGHITPPRLLPAANAPSRLIVSDLRVPVEVVRRRAGDFADYARRHGTLHSMKLWRACYQQALQSLAREAGHVAAAATCEALFWEQKGGEYWISATFGQPPAAPLH